MVEEQQQVANPDVPLFNVEIETFQAFYWANWRMVAKDLDSSDRKKIFRGVEKLYDKTEAAVKAKERVGPKKATCPYFLFNKEMFSTVAKKVKEEGLFQGLDVPKETARELGRIWKSMTAEERGPYVKAAAELKKKQEVEMGEFYSPK